MKPFIRHKSSAPRYTPLPTVIVVLAMVLSLAALFPAGSRADLQTPAWWDSNAVSTAPDWHYRVPITIPANAAENCTIRVDVNFNQLLTTLGAGGTFDPKSPRVVRPGGTLADEQQFTDTVYNRLTDAAGNGRGEVRFILDDDGPATYYLYFDVVENGPKPAWDVDDTINGNFEFLDTPADRLNPPGWQGYVRTGHQAQTIDNGAPVTVTDSNGSPSTITTNEDAQTGQRCYLLGARDNAEPNGWSTVLSGYIRRRIDLPATNRGMLRIRYRVKGWDSSDTGQTRYDFLRIQVRRNNIQVIQELVGPNGSPYATLPYSPNQGLSSYGPYNGGTTEQWYEAVYDLSSTTRNRITIYIESRNYYQYKSWFHIDNVEWSVVDASLGAPQLFGVNITDPTVATVYADGDTFIIRAQVDAEANTVSADLFNPVGTLVAANIVLFNDGSHGDGTAGDAFWTNNGSVPAEFTYMFLPTDMPGTDWQVVVTAQDTQIGVTDAQMFTLVTPPNIMLLKTALTVSDPVNGGSNPKAIPGALMEYTITASNQGGTGTDANTVFVTDPIPNNTDLYVGSPVMPGGPVTYSDGAVSSGLGFIPANHLRFSNDNGATFNLTIGDLSADPNGCDPSITHWQVNPSGIFAAAANGNIPEFTLRFRVRVQ